jgi:hypothetical protein
MNPFLLPLRQKTTVEVEYFQLAGYDVNIASAQTASYVTNFLKVSITA